MSLRLGATSDVLIIRSGYIEPVPKSTQEWQNTTKYKSTKENKAMHSLIEDIPVALEEGGYTSRMIQWGDSQRRDLVHR